MNEINYSSFLRNISDSIGSITNAINILNNTEAQKLSVEKEILKNLEILKNKNS